MARAGNRKAAKHTAASNNNPKPPPPPTSGPPSPFQYAPGALQPFLSTLPTDHIYLVHIDNTPASLKTRVFVVPLLLNLLITIGLCVRMYYAAPVYFQQIITIFGYDTAYTVDTKTAGAGELISTLSSRTFLLMTDYFIFAFIGNWPKEFMFGGKVSRFVGPRQWRTTLGFRDTEIIVRRGRIWDTRLLTPEMPDGVKTWKVDEELTIKVKIDPAMRADYLAKTGYLLLDKDWDLDFEAMLDAHELVDTGTIQLKDLESLALVYYQKNWLIWRVNESPVVEAEAGPQDDALEKFRSQLADLGAEDVFFRWIEIVQYETSQPGGFTEGRQAEALRELKHLLSKKGVDYAQFWSDIGGQAGLPGLDAQI
ncbi:hypothetical protein LTR10_020595 [Elasticomyces elasticus]|uniref:Band 7 domain-containing protein n=1 Tax=Exophiala sideris TaxID=1016849 RepID=A0ABR0JKY4_9EURO|nr:hypothetical protein LTR10_020595 [Elasticomyces elasticus]KAK5035450.1 hypothetical protein LTS07_002888 [Exophiala sideris]KAK5039199.1 hypothetical protein LTR13_003455 [Exophiala sideris]KAK5066375.1 hypothetical protein LTR69_002894 [Exophiala sideris]KAK5187052.1 hypothetical protein LTR44_001059 [Eurotiomycetes sp. CCFEE 6388]